MSRAALLVRRMGLFPVVRVRTVTGALELLSTHTIAGMLAATTLGPAEASLLVEQVREEHPRLPLFLVTGCAWDGVHDSPPEVGGTRGLCQCRLRRELPGILQRLWMQTHQPGRESCLFLPPGDRICRLRIPASPAAITGAVELLKRQAAALGRWGIHDCQRLGAAIEEALRNSLFHGNLELSNDLRVQSEAFYHAEAERRLQVPPYCGRSIVVESSHDALTSTYVIRDEGPGFDIRLAGRTLEPDALMRPVGRGILIMRAFMDEVTYHHSGNQVRLVKRHPLVPPRQRRARLLRGLDVAATSACPTTAQSDQAKEPDAAALPTSGPRQSETPLMLAGSSLDAWINLFDEGLCLVDDDRILRHWNSGMERLIGFAASEVLGRSLDEVFADRLDAAGAPLGEQRDLLLNPTRPAAGGDQAIRLTHRSGKPLYCELKSRPLPGPTGGVQGAALQFIDLSGKDLIRQVHHRLRELSSTDPLTGVLNRRGLDEWLSRTLTASPTQPGDGRDSLCLAIADIDHFKRINDSYGHAAGDEVLKRFAQILASTCRDSDAVARFGGEEFVVLMPRSTLDEAIGVAQRIRAAIGNAVPPEMSAVHLTASLGLAEARSGDTPGDLLDRADKAVYLAKQRGRDQVCVFEELPADSALRPSCD